MCFLRKFDWGDLFDILYMVSVNDKRYQDLLDDYRSKLSELRKAERRREDATFIRFIDAERDAVHRELRKVGALLGKSAEEIALDLLVSEKDLSEYNLSEFKILHTKNALDQITWVREIDQYGATISKYKSSQVDIYDNSEWLPQGVMAFIPFGQQENFHLFDDDDYVCRDSEELERRRRLFRLINLAGGIPIEVHSQKTYHQAVTLFGIGYAPENLEYLFRIMREHQSDISINPQFFSKEQIREDFHTIINEDLEHIFSYAKDTEENVHLIERFKYSIISILAHKKENLMDDFNEIITRALRRAEKLDRHEIVEQELDRQESIEGSAQNWIEKAERKRANYQ